MRRMRGFAWYHLLFALPAIAAAFGLQYFMRKNYPQPANPDQATAMKPSAYRAGSGDGADADGERKPASHGAAKRKGGKTQVSRAEPSDDFNDDSDADLASRIEETERPAVAHLNSARHDDAPVIGKGGCAPIEYRGDGPMATAITPKEWATVVDQFLESKKLLGGWLNQNRKGFPDRTVELMEKQLAATKLQKPPALEEPDLSWRGVGVWTVDANNAPLIRIGAGFVKLAVKNPARAKFELARLVAQSWAPCELARGTTAEAWDPLTQCLGVNESAACAPGTYSEAGWAVSTALGSIVANPGCTVPAFAEKEVAQCLKKVPLPLLAANGGAAHGTSTREPASTTSTATGHGDTHAAPAAAHAAPAATAVNPMQEMKEMHK